jgi:hypothetical protein
MRRSLAMVAVLLTACAPAADPPDAPSATPAPTPSTGATPSPTPEQALTKRSQTPAPPAEAPSVEGEWAMLETGPLTSEEAIDAAALPDGLKAFLKEALLDEVIAAEEWAEEFPDCPVEARVTALHPAGFAVGSVLGCGPDGLMGIFAGTAEAWGAAVSALPEPPECEALAEAGVPAGVPVDWDEGFRCAEGGGWRYW